jgi:mono/diheme cytochrome c family protein
LIGLSGKYSAQQVEGLLKDPTPKMKAGGMPTPQLKPEEMDALVAYLESLK